MSRVSFYNSRCTIIIINGLDNKSNFGTVIVINGFDNNVGLGSVTWVRILGGSQTIPIGTIFRNQNWPRFFIKVKNCRPTYI
jgi:hypothetical protein